MLNDSMEEKAFFRYTGSSMWPVFQTGDLLVVKRVLQDQLRPGDCIVFRKVGGENYIIHRIVGVKSEIRTRGDARPVGDDEPVFPVWIMGRVEGRIRCGHLNRISGGRRGVWEGRFYRYAGRLEPSREAKGGRIAKCIQQFLGRLSTRWVCRASVLNLPSEEGHKLSYLVWGKRVVGLRFGQGQAWSILWPYCLLIDPQRLPPAKA